MHRRALPGLAWDRPDRGPFALALRTYLPVQRALAQIVGLIRRPLLVAWWHSRAYERHRHGA